MGTKSGYLPQLGRFIIENKNENDEFFVNISEMRGKHLGFEESSYNI